MLEKRSLTYTDGPISVPIDETFLVENVQRICICDTGTFYEFRLCLILEKELGRRRKDNVYSCLQVASFS